jgi:hypothetical protein
VKSCLLSKLNLTKIEHEALRRNGFVSAEQRRHRLIYKLRFRLNGRQCVRSLGSDPLQVDEFANWLREWQRQRRAELQARHLANLVNHQLRAAKGYLQPLVERAGFIYHGRAIRRPRKLVGRTHGTANRRKRSMEI